MLSKTLALGAGCYWGTEKYIVKDFQKKFPNSIESAVVGFMSPDPNAMKNPSYRQVCSGTTGHVEVLFVTLKSDTPDETFMKELFQFFFQFHDPTTLNRQGNDAGTQYASYIFCNDEEQAKIAESVKAELQALITAKKVTTYSGPTIHTKITSSMNQFYPAQEEHQQYLFKNPNGYCNHRIRFQTWPKLETCKHET